MVIFLVYPNPSPQKRVFLRYLSCIATQGRRSVMRQKIAVPTEFLLPHYISHFLNLFKTVEA